MAPQRKPKEFVLHEQTLSRRDLLDWMGKATVFSLSGGVLAACLSGEDPDGGRAPDAEAGGEREHAPGGDDAREAEAIQGEGSEADAEAAPDADEAAAHEAEAAPEPEAAGGDFPFAEGEADHSVYQGWGERTVDRQDLAEILASWELTIDGLVEAPVTLSFLELVDLRRQDQVTDFHCVEGWSIYDVPWNGVHLSTLFDLVRPTDGATHVTFHTVPAAGAVGNRYNESLPLDVALEPRTVLAYGIGGSTLPLKHGFPVRLVVPRLLAYKSAKYVERIELTDHPIEGFWVAAGYPYDAEVPEGRLRDGKW